MNAFVANNKIKASVAMYSVLASKKMFVLMKQNCSTYIKT